MINTTIAKLALQALLGRRRFFLLLAFPVLLIGLVALVTALVDGDAAYEVLPNLGYPLVLPLVAILAVLSAWPALVTERSFPLDQPTSFIAGQEQGP